ncbi:Hypothetical predicted protein [Olea europaea subsp. europaea]|uniref:P53 and DNA damage-regulated protein 1 n=1 Tax=Olea europaea subsp. europaea TaxID=158383 RepID=A0A8S0VIU8_OLEEU|nr:Hypothetical predicted protein [Olea europaea subsp. europaea]
MNEIMKQFQQGLIEVETEAENLLLACQPQGLIEVEMEVENLLLARQPLVDNDRVRQGNREVLTALRKRAQTTKTSVPLCFKSVMWYVESRPLVKEVCATCGDHDSKEKMWLMFLGTDLFASIPFHSLLLIPF